MDLKYFLILGFKSFCRSFFSLDEMFSFICFLILLGLYHKILVGVWQDYPFYLFLSLWFGLWTFWKLWKSYTDERSLWAWMIRQKGEAQNRWVKGSSFSPVFRIKHNSPSVLFDRWLSLLAFSSYSRGWSFELITPFCMVFFRIKNCFFLFASAFVFFILAHSYGTFGALACGFFWACCWIYALIRHLDFSFWEIQNGLSHKVYDQMLRWGALGLSFFLGCGWFALSMVKGMTVESGCKDGLFAASALWAVPLGFFQIDARKFFGVISIVFFLDLFFWTALWYSPWAIVLLPFLLSYGSQSQNGRFYMR